MGVVYLLLATVSVLLSIQATYTLYLMVYTWDQPTSYRRTRAPDRFEAPHRSFTVMLPARHEERVIQTTLERVVAANYPASLVQILVICSWDDAGTIARAEDKIKQLGELGREGIELVVFQAGPINKPHALNSALIRAGNDVVTVFDAEDDIHPDIFNVVNTVMLEESVHVIQAGVQLMNYRSSWYSTLNVLEYFFWFKSCLHYYARYGSTPLGGNTVFFDRATLLRVGGWDENNLTEDADIGIRLSTMGEGIRVVYDDRYVTREETPPTLGHFIRQRTRWCQGFMQTLAKGDWRRMPARAQRWLAVYTLAFPVAQAILGIYAILSLVAILAMRAPVLVALISYVPVFLLAAHFLTTVIGLREFTEAHGLKASWWTVLLMGISWFPYQLILAYSALRAARRLLLGENNWEKTAHVGAHREQGSMVDDAA
jgi:cellulose synthase/poly-beta-1,6-N-acetylglucosamine synthase-like glycosyltransferase